MVERPPAPATKSEGGFTLIELLVAVLIIAVLASISVPVFLQQRKKAWVAQIESALKDAATAQESFRAQIGANAYTSDWTELLAEGFNYSSNEIKLETIVANYDGYCLRMSSLNNDDVRGVYSSVEGFPRVVTSGPAVAAPVPNGGACSL